MTMTENRVDAILQQKAELRREALARRDALPAEIRKAAAEAITARPFPLAVAPGMIVSGFMPLLYGFLLAEHRGAQAPRGAALPSAVR